MKRIKHRVVACRRGLREHRPVPENLKPAANESLALVVPAKGVQIYECRDGKWAFVAPEAELFDRARQEDRHATTPARTGKRPTAARSSAR